MRLRVWLQNIPKLGEIHNDPEVPIIMKHDLPSWVTDHQHVDPDHQHVDPDHQHVDPDHIKKSTEMQSNNEDVSEKEESSGVNSYREELNLELEEDSPELSDDSEELTKKELEPAGLRSSSGIEKSLTIKGKKAILVKPTRNKLKVDESYNKRHG